MRYIAADTETTGKAEPIGICDVALVEIDEHAQVVHSIGHLIDPVMPICPGASGIHHIVYEDVADSPTLEEFVEFILPAQAGFEWVAAKEEVVLVAHNAGFDRPLLERFMHISDALCTLRLVRHVYPDAPDHKLSTMMYYLGLPKAESHRALADTLTVVHLLQRVIKDTGKSLAELHALSKSPIYVSRWAFGKHAGTELKDTPRDYLSWAVKTFAAEPDKRDLVWSIKQVLNA